jgi:4-hydroxy-tetrahydrodipicolinate synthase
MTLEELKGRMKGIFVVLITPFKENGDLDEAALRENVRWLASYAEGKDFVFTPCGSTGEFYAMTYQERNRVLEIVVEEVNGRLPVLGGTGAAGTRLAVELTRAAEAIGCDGAQIILPYYHKPDEDGMFAHYRAISEAVGPDFGLQIYNNPAVSGCWVKPHLMQRIAALGNVISNKDNQRDVARFVEMLRAIDPDQMAILTGLGPRFYTMVALFGCPGFISVPANYAPEISWAVYQAGVKGDLAAMEAALEPTRAFDRYASQVARAHAPSTSVEGGPGMVWQAMIKAAMTHRGLAGGFVRLPMSNLTPEEHAGMHAVVREMGLGPLG